ncbi:MAG: hypothetical protein HC841_00540 [Verrucomicrobiae bacterium]|nr:hypothetical protein [Verrucomicrobiae bacterium]
MITRGHLSDFVRTSRILSSQTAGATDISSATVIDTQDFDAARFILSIGVLTATQVTSAKVQQSDDSGGSPDDWTDVEGSEIGPFADDDDEQIAIIDIARPTKRYLRLYIDRATANAEVDGVLCEQYNARNVPVTQSATVFGVVRLNNPEEGTA